MFTVDVKQQYNNNFRITCNDIYYTKCSLKIYHKDQYIFNTIHCTRRVIYYQLQEIHKEVGEGRGEARRVGNVR